MKQVKQYLRERYQAQCLKFPLTRKFVTEKQYVSANLRYALRNAKAKESTS